MLSPETARLSFMVVAEGTETISRPLEIVGVNARRGFSRSGLWSLQEKNLHKNCQATQPLYAF